MNKEDILIFNQNMCKISGKNTINIKENTKLKQKCKNAHLGE